MASSLDLISTFGPGVVVFIFAYAAFWAFNIRRALAVRLYRNQALGIGIVAVGLASGLAILQLPLGDLWFLPVYSAFIIVFYWIDASVLASRRSDPLLRDTLHWSKLRILLWALNTIPMVVLLSFIAYFRILEGSIPPDPGILGEIGFSAPFFVTTISGAAFVPIIAQRSKNITLRKHFRWFGLFVAFVFLLDPLGSLTTNDPFLMTLSFFVALLGGGYCLYRSARSLVPLNRLSVPATG